MCVHEDDAINDARGCVMHEPQASALRNRERHCIIRVHHIETRIVR